MIVVLGLLGLSVLVVPMVMTEDTPPSRSTYVNASHVAFSKGTKNKAEQKFAGMKEIEKIMPKNILPDNLDADDNLNADDFFDYWSKNNFETFEEPVKELCFEISKGFKALAQHIKDKFLTVEAMDKDATFNKLVSKLKNLMSDLKKKKGNEPSWDKEDDGMLFGWEYVLSHKNVLYGKVLAILADDYWKCKPIGAYSIKTQFPKPQIKNTQVKASNLTNSAFTLQPLPGGGYNVVPNYETVPIIKKSSSHSQSRSNEHTERISEENINKYYDLKKRELESKLGAEGRDSSIGMWQMSDLENKRRRALINAKLSNNKTNTDDVINNHYDQAKRELERTVDPNSAEGIRQIALLENERRKAMMDANFSQITKGKSWLY